MRTFLTLCACSVTEPATLLGRLWRVLTAAAVSLTSNYLQGLPTEVSVFFRDVSQPIDCRRTESLCLKSVSVLVRFITPITILRINNLWFERYFRFINTFMSSCSIISFTTQRFRYPLFVHTLFTFMFLSWSYPFCSRKALKEAANNPFPLVLYLFRITCVLT
jgi:hypothetical protein